MGARCLRLLAPGLPVLRGLLQSGIPFAVSGGFSFHHHTGIWRTTKDLDLVVPPGALCLWRSKVLVEERLRYLYVQDPVWLAKARRGDYFVDLITGVGNATLTVEQSWIDRADEAEVPSASAARFSASKR